MQIHLSKNNYIMSHDGESCSELYSSA